MTLFQTRLQTKAILRLVSALLQTQVSQISKTQVNSKSLIQVTICNSFQNLR